MTFPESADLDRDCAQDRGRPEKLAQALFRLVAEDPALSVKSGESPGDVVIGGVSELHLEIVIDRLRRGFNVEASVGRPLIALQGDAHASGRRRDEMTPARSGGRGHYGHVKIHVYPGEPGTGYVFENEVVQGAIPEQFISPIREGLEEALMRGVVARLPDRRRSHPAARRLVS